jgi:hypothetical protein
MNFRKDQKLSSDVLRTVATALCDLVRNAMLQQWFVREFEGILQMPARKGLVGILGQTASRNPLSNAMRASLPQVSIVAVILLTMFGDKQKKLAWSLFFSDAFPKLDQEEFARLFPHYVKVINRWGWTDEVIAEFIVGLCRVRTCF